MQPDKDSDVTPRHRGKSGLRSLTDLLRLTTPTDPGGPAIVFIHIPKTAGTSFRAAAEQYFGNSSVERDYGAEDPYTTDIVLETVYSNRIEGLPTAMEQASRRMLAGHFPATKYHQLFANNVRWCTFLRDPVQRVISEHRHLVKKNRYAHSLEYFCNTKAECNKQTRLLRGIEEKDLYFVGVAEHFRASISVFNKLAGTRFKYTRTNVARKSLSEAYDVSDRVRKTIENNNRDDLALYSKHAARYAD
ncbi:MAG: sulfotransferase family 2 domain-containing protein [Gammaproteobacteria bacterium]|nr:sulfotransferase family 2 domain-containing protein [Gammaproteobacteria bacterium]